MKDKDDVADRQMDFAEESFGFLLAELFKIKGYKASAILTSDGEQLFSNFTGKAAANPSSWPETINKLFARTCHLSEISGFLGCDQVAMRTGDELVIIRSSGKDCLVGIRLLVIVDHHSNEAIINLQLQKLLPRLMRRLTWDPDNLVRLYLQDLQVSPPAAAASCYPAKEGESVN